MIVTGTPPGAQAALQATPHAGGDGFGLAWQLHFEGALACQERAVDDPPVLPVPIPLARHDPAGSGGLQPRPTAAVEAEAPDLPAFSDRNLSVRSEPVRIHAQLGPAGVHLWVGVDARSNVQLESLAQTVRQVLGHQGLRLASITCNGAPLLARTTPFAKSDKEKEPEWPLMR